MNTQSRPRKLPSPPPKRALHSAGFSLLELLVVITIVAVLSTSAVLSLRLGPSQSPSSRMDELARAIRFLQAETLYADRTFALSLSRAGWEVLSFAEAGQTWQRRPENLLYHHGNWGSAGAIEVEIEGRPVTLEAGFNDVPRPDVFLLPGGETTPFEVRLVSGRHGSARCALSGFGDLTCDS